MWLIGSACQTAFSISTDDSVKGAGYLCCNLSLALVYVHTSIDIFTFQCVIV